MAQPRASVIIPVYNARYFLEQCLDSALSQLDGEVQVICVDDGSTDGSLEYLEQRAVADKRIEVFRQEHRGAGSARNLGMRNAVGDFLHFLDADDYLEPGIFEKAIRKAEEESADIVVFQVLDINMQTGKRQIADWAFVKANFPSKAFAPFQMSSRLFNTFLSWAHNKLFRRSFVSECNLQFQEIFRTNDLFFVDTALVEARCIAVLEEVGINYRSHQAASSQGTNSSHPRDFYEAWIALEEYLQSRGLWETYQESFVNEALHSCVYNLNSQKSSAAFIELYEFLRSEGFDNLGIASAKNESFFYRSDYQHFLKMRDLASSDLAVAGWRSLDFEISHSRELRYLRALRSSVLCRGVKRFLKLMGNS